MDFEGELRILMVEDNPDDQHLIERVLRKENLAFVSECVDKLDEFTEALVRFRPDIVLSDHGMPEFNSFEALKICLDEHADMPFILVTGTVSDEYAISCLRNGVDDYILKSNLSRLPSAIRSVVKKRNLEKLKREAELILRKQNEELDNFVYSVSHNLRGPLLSVVGLLNIAECEDENIDFSDLHARMRTCISRLNDTLSDIIEYSRNSRNEVMRDYVDWVEIIRSTFLKVGYLHQGELITKMLTLNTLVPFFSDTKRIEVILYNLFVNAVSYRSKDRGLIIGVEVYTSDDSATIIIKDNGTGIEEEVLPKVYNMFYRGTETSQGAGLGLYIVKEIVEKLKGQVTITSVVGDGTSVTVKIPLEPLWRKRESVMPAAKHYSPPDVAITSHWIVGKMQTFL